MSHLGWAISIIAFILVPIIVVGVIFSLLPHRRNPIIMDRPQPDPRRDLHRDFRVGGDAK